MGKTKTSAKRKVSSKDTPPKGSASRKLKTGTGLRKWSPNQALLDKDHIGRALVECLEEGDHEGFMETIESYINALKRAGRTKDAEAQKIAFSRNPSIQTIAKHVHSVAA